MIANELQRRTYRNEGNSALLRFLPHDTQKVLDVGCGAGDNARLLKASGCRIWGITLSESEAGLARTLCEEVKVVDIEASDLGFPKEFFDAIVCSHVLEHLVRPQAVAARLADYVKQGGTLLIAVPNMAHWRLRLRFLFGNWRFEETGSMDSTHLHFWSFQTAREMLAPPWRLKIHVAGNPAMPLWPLRRFLPGMCRRMDILAARLFPNLFAIQTILVAEKVG